MRAAHWGTHYWGAHRSLHTQGTLFPQVRCCGEAPGLAAPGTAPAMPAGLGAPQKMGTPPPQTHIPSPAPCPSLGAPLLLSSFLWFWAWGGFGCRAPPKVPGSPRSPCPAPPASPRPPSSLVPAGLCSDNFLSLSLSLSSFSLWFLFFFFFFLIPSVFFFSLPFEKNPNGNIHFHFLLSRSRDEGEGRAMKRAFFSPTPLVLVSFFMVSFLFPRDVQKCKRYISLSFFFHPPCRRRVVLEFFCFCVC